VKRGVERQKADVDGLNTHPDFFERRLRVNLHIWQDDEQD
jgi:hypothetical protein